MRTISPLLISLVFLAFFSALAPGNCITNTDLDQVLSVVRDTEGKPLDSGARYFLVSARGGRRGVRLANLGGQEQNTCATAVIQSPFDLGIGVYFKPKNPKQKEIVESTSVNIMFYLDTYLCFNFTVWKVDNYPKPEKHYTISTGAKLGNSLDVNSWFQIKPLSGEFYKLVFCPYGEKFTCQNVGIIQENGYRRLTLSEKPEFYAFKYDGLIGKAIA